MRIFSITKTGLWTISLAVLVLWTCFFMERSFVRRARFDAVASLRALDALKQRTTPVAEPVSPFHRHIPRSS